jgi:hypothetical protein
MKGPGGRMRFDLRRVWECPVCHRREWTGGDIVYRMCTCSAKAEPPRQIWMKLIEAQPAAVASQAVDMPQAEPTKPEADAATPSPTPAVTATPHQS